MPPHYGDGGIQPVAATPPAMWVNVTGNLAGMASECGNTPYLAVAPQPDMLITSVAKQGLWSSTDGGASWKQLWAGSGHAADHEPRLVDGLRPGARRHVLGVGHLQRPRRLPHHRQRRDLHGARRRPPHRLGQRRSLRPAAPNAAGRRPRAEEDPLSLGRRRRHVDQRRREPARRHELLHERPRHRQEHPPRRVARATRAAPTGFSAPPTAARRGRPRRRHRRPRRRSGPPTARSIGRSSTTAASSRAPTRAGPGRRPSRAGR